VDASAITAWLAVVQESSEITSNAFLRLQRFATKAVKESTKAKLTSDDYRQNLRMIADFSAAISTFAGEGTARVLDSVKSELPKKAFMSIDKAVDASNNALPADFYKHLSLKVDWPAAVAEKMYLGWKTFLTLEPDDASHQSNGCG